MIDISILDSSFNPPTLAHLALSRLSPPLTTTTARGHFDAKLLLYSIKNADKVPKPGDATLNQKIDMMILFAKELESIGSEENDLGSQNVAVAVCQEPIFVEKSKILQTYLRSKIANLSQPLTLVRLTFVMGTDTLERVLMSKYYGSEDAMQAALESLFTPSNTTQSYILCVRRALGESYLQSDSELADKVKNYGAIAFTDMADEHGCLNSLSSSEVRKNIHLGKTSSWKHQVLDTIANYIEKQPLYQEG